MKNDDNMRRDIIDALKSRDYAPSSLRELAALLEVPKSGFGAFKRTIADMVKSGELAHVKGGKFCVSGDIGLVAGVIRFRQSGAAYIELDNGSEVAVRREDTGVSLNGDRVLARILDERQGGRRKRREKSFGGVLPYAVLKPMQPMPTADTSNLPSFLVFMVFPPMYAEAVILCSCPFRMPAVRSRWRRRRPSPRRPRRAASPCLPSRGRSALRGTWRRTAPPFLTTGCRIPR